MDIQELQPAIKDYLRNLKKHIRVSSALLFGSIAEGKKQANDVDLLILSEDFASLDPDERSRLLYRISVGFPYDLHVFGFTPQELSKASPLTAIGQIRNSKTLSLL